MRNLMSDRKYRQRGYQDDDRDRPGSPETATSRARDRCACRGAANLAGRPRNHQHAGLSRGRSLRAMRQPSVSSEVALDGRCPRCGVDLHACAQCTSFDPGSRFECMQQIPARITPKNARNTCALFSARTTVERETTRRAPTTRERRLTTCSSSRGPAPWPCFLNRTVRPSAGHLAVIEDDRSRLLFFTQTIGAPRRC